MPSVRRRLLIKPLELNRAKQMVPTSTMDTKCGRNISVWQVFLKNLALISASMMAKAIRSAVPMTMKMMLYRSVFAVNVHAAPQLTAYCIPLLTALALAAFERRTADELN